MIFRSFLAVFLLINQCIALETGIGESETQFRMNKLNMIWKKAQNKMSEQKLSDFRRLLELQDRAEIRWKELKAKGGDEDGEMEAMIRQKFARILEQFGLEKHLDPTDRGGNEINDNKAGNGMFGDRRLSELWESVEKQGLYLLVSLIRWAKGFSLKIISNCFRENETKPMENTRHPAYRLCGDSSIDLHGKTFMRQSHVVYLISLSYLACIHVKDIFTTVSN